MAGLARRALEPLLLTITLLSCSAVAAHAQQRVEQSQLPPVPQAKSTAPAQPRAPAAKGGATDGQGAQAAAGDQGLRQRVEQLEEQLVDLQVVIGTLESLARSGAANTVAARPPVSGGALSPNDQARLDSMETQIRALSAQIEQLSADIKGQGGQPRRSDAGGGAFPDPTIPHAAAPSTGATGTGRFGSTTVTSGTGDPIAGVIADDDRSVGETGNLPGNGGLPGNSGAMSSPAPQSPQAPGPMAAADPAASGQGGNPKQAYENAYGFLLQQDYAAAQSGFSDFLRRYPQDPLAPNALYWLGETHYVQKNYSDAAEAFDLVLSTYATSAKAPDAQLKRAMALSQLGKKQDACTALRQLGTKFPNAPAHVKTKAESERQRFGCT